MARKTNRKPVEDEDDDKPKVKKALPIVVDLEEPFTFGKEEITSFTISRRPKAKDLKGITAGDMMMDDMFRIISRVCDQPLKCVEELDMVDMNRIAEEIQSFL